MTARKRKNVLSGKKTGSRGIKKRNSQLFKKMKKFILLGIGLIVVLMIFYGFRALVSGNWDGAERYNLLLGKEGERVVFVSLSGSDKDMLVLIMDSQIMIDTVHGYGEYKIGSLLKLGRMEGLGSSLFQDSISNTLGVKIHAYLPISVNGSNVEEEGWYKNLWQKMITSLIGTKVGITDVTRYFESVSSLRSDQIEIFPVHESRLAFKKLDVDGADLYYLDKLRLDGYLQDRLFEIKISDENIGLSVINTISTPGLASRFSRFLLSTGIDVVGVSENSMSKDVTTILIRDDSLYDTQTLKYIQSLIPYAEIEEGRVDDFRSDIVVLLGSDYGDYLYSKN